MKFAKILHVITMNFSQNAQKKKIKNKKICDFQNSRLIVGQLKCTRIQPTNVFNKKTKKGKKIVSLGTVNNTK